MAITKVGIIRKKSDNKMSAYEKRGGGL